MRNDGLIGGMLFFVLAILFVLVSYWNGEEVVTPELTPTAIMEPTNTLVPTATATTFNGTVPQPTATEEPTAVPTVTPEDG